MRIGRWIMLGLGGAAVFLFWRSQQARDKVTQVFNSATGRVQQPTSASPGMPKPSHTSNAGQPNRSSTTPATTTRLSQTNPDAGVSMGAGTASRNASDAAANTASSAAADHNAGAVRGTDATVASGESSFAQPVVRALDAQDGSAQADEPTSSRSEQHDATVDNVIESSHQPDSTEASKSPAQTSAPASSTAQATRPSDMEVVPGDDPDAGQLMADGDDRTITDRIRSRLGQELDHKEWGHLNINTQAMGDVYLRGYVVSEELRSQIEQIVSETAGVQSVVNELNVEEQAE